jgi:hypothetical protein
MLTSKHFYNQTLKKTVAVFGTVFNNLRVVKHGGVEERVPISYGPRQKFLARLTQETRQDNHFAIKVPRMAFEITDLSYDTNASLNKINNVCYGTPEAGTGDIMRQSVPYTLTMELNVISKTQDEALQIVEQILPTFTPEYTVAIADMYFPGKSNDVPIVLNSVTLQDEYEGDFEARKIIIYTLTFTMKIRFYGTKEPKPIIRSVTADIYTSDVDDSPSNPDDRVQVDLGSESDTPSNFSTVTTFGFADDSP